MFPLPIEDPKPCALCTKQMCIDSVTDGTCDGIKDSTCPSVDFKGLCFGKLLKAYEANQLTLVAYIPCYLARDSYKDEAIVWSFLVLTFSLIAIAAIKPTAESWWKVIGILRTLD